MVAAAELLRAQGRSESFIRHHVFAPFIIGGSAYWSNTWGARREDADGSVRHHLGQDVFCDLGTPVLAAESGEIEFTSDELGGSVARLYRDDGGHFYYAHLADHNDARFDSGDRVRPGDVIGYCGDTGNAVGSSPHVHFGFYSGVAQDPMGLLIEWNERAQRRARAALSGSTRWAASSELARRFGEGLLPELSSKPALEQPYGSLEVFIEGVLDESAPEIPEVIPEGGFPNHSRAG